MFPFRHDGYSARAPPLPVRLTNDDAYGEAQREDVREAGREREAERGSDGTRSWR